jgi:2-polyprenyl-3-methyl-5-hydroxy-6-metoxy-1,4-benzoquinol methylase
MTSRLSPQDLERINAGIREKYHKVARTPKGHFIYPTGRLGLEGLGYDPRLLADLPDSVADAYCGVGNPFSLGEVEPGSAVLDIGCGSGVDTLLAARMAGETGEALGIDITPEMIRRANENKKAMKAGNVEFRVSGVQDLAGMENRFDLVVSNGVFNLIPDKKEAIEAALQLLKPKGRLFLADQFQSGPVEKDLRARVDSWFQ